MPKWGVPFDFVADDPETDENALPPSDGVGGPDPFQVTQITAPAGAAPKCFIMKIFQKKGEKLCEFNLKRDLEEQLAPNKVVYKNKNEIERSIKRLPFELIGCFKNENLDIEVALR